MSDLPLATRILHRIATDAAAHPKALALAMGAHVGSVRRVLRRMERAGLIVRAKSHGPWVIAALKYSATQANDRGADRGADRVGGDRRSLSLPGGKASVPASAQELINF